MEAISIKKRRNWKRHVKDHAYHVDALTSMEEPYWVEALDNPFAIRFSMAEAGEIEDATCILWDACIRAMDSFFEDESPGAVDKRLEQLKIRKEYWELIKNSWAKENPEELALASRFDFAVTDSGSIKCMEINAETALLGCETVYQWNWLESYRSLFPRDLPGDTTQSNDYWDLIGIQWRKIVEEYDIRKHGISFLVDERLEEDREYALQLIQILHDEVDPDIFGQIVTLRDDYADDETLIQRGIAFSTEDGFVDHSNDRIPVLWKMYDWSDFQNDMANDRSTDEFAEMLGTGMTKVIEPLWKQVLSNKGFLCWLWKTQQETEARKYLLPTYFEGDTSTGATALLVSSYVRKPILGLEGVGVSINVLSGSMVSKPTLGYGAEGFVIQEYVELPKAYGVWNYMVGSWSIDGDAGGIIIRGDRNMVTGRHCLIIPHVVTDGVFTK